MDILDSHCHLDLILERNESLDAILDLSMQYGVSSILQIATGLQSSKWNKALVDGHDAHNKPQIYWTAGMHPENTADLGELEELLTFIRENHTDPMFWGIGETGLDYFHTTEFQKNQIKSLEMHMQLASELGLPIVLHTRDDKSYNPEKIGSIVDALDICNNFPNVIGVLHCFTYTDREAQGFIDLGWFVSYSGVLTFNNAKDVQRGAVHVPLDQLLVETDAPFLAPAPHRGKTNQPAFTKHTLDFLVNLRSTHNQEDPQAVYDAINKNSVRFLNLKKT